MKHKLIALILIYVIINQNYFWFRSFNINQNL